MAFREHLKDQSKKYEYRKHNFWFMVFLAFVFAVALLMVAGVDFTKILYWNFFDVLNAYDYELGGFFHKVFYTLKVIMDGIKIYFTLHNSNIAWESAKSSLETVWHTSAFNFLPESFKMKFKNISELNNVAHTYFMTVNVFIVVFFIFYGYFYKSKVIRKLLPAKAREFIYTYMFHNFIFSGVDYKTLKELNISRGEFFDAFEDKVMERYLKVIDGYERVKQLKILHKMFNVWSHGGKYDYALNYIVQAFRTPDDLIDLLKITEGYLTKKGEEKFDRLIDNMTFEEFLKYKAFNGKDEVTFSLHAMLYFLDLETQQFKKLIEKRLLKGRNILHVQLRRYKPLLVADAERVTKMLYGVNNKKSTIVGQKENEQYNEMMKAIENGNMDKWWKLFLQRLKEVLISQFRFIVSREIINKYTNIPAGTIVSKLDDYTMRLIVDTYRNEALIDIKKGVNDGSSKSFENDILANIFLMSYIYYNKFGMNETSIQDRIRKIWNLDILDDFSEIKMQTDIAKNIYDFSKFDAEIKEKAKQVAIEEMKKLEEEQKGGINE